MEKTMDALEKKRAWWTLNKALVACINAEQVLDEARRVLKQADERLYALEAEEQRPDRWE